MTRVLSALVFLLLPAAVLADGKAFPTIAFPANVTIPDQRALIHYTNGTERLVVETRFTGSGTNFAWVVPLPSQPLIEEASTGLFPTLQYLFRPQIKHNIPKYYVAILSGIAFIFLLRMAAKSLWQAFLICLLLLFLALLFLPSLGGVKTAGIHSSPTGGVTVLDRAIVGIFETATIASRDPKALQTWLRENGFALSTNAEPVIESYVKGGWVFVAAKVARDHPEHATSAPHPLSFTFRTDRPVYPMRLTGVDNGSVEVELYVFAENRAEAPHFKVVYCTQPNYPKLPTDNQRPYWPPKLLNIVHPLLRKWVDGSAVATKLTAKLTPSQMRNDVWLRSSEFCEKKSLLFSHSGALTCGLNYGASLLAVGLLVVFVRRDIVQAKGKPCACSKAVRAVVLLSVLVTCVIYLALPKTAVRLVKSPSTVAETAVFLLSLQLPYHNEVTREEISAEARREIEHPTEGADWLRLVRTYGGTGRENFLLGGDIREEDSPGNFTLRENGENLEFVIYDHQGAECVLKKTWQLRQNKSSDATKRCAWRGLIESTTLA